MKVTGTLIIHRIRIAGRVPLICIPRRTFTLSNLIDVRMTEVGHVETASRSSRRLAVGGSVTIIKVSWWVIAVGDGAYFNPY